MKLLFINGYISPKEYNEIFEQTKGEFQFAAQLLQEKLIVGLSNIFKDDFYMISAPFINPYPRGYKKINYIGSTPKSNEKYVSFFNLWGARNISRKHKLIKNSKDFLKLQDKEKYIIVYSPHVPFLETAYYLKKKDPKVKIILLLPDLPQFISLGNNKSFIYKVLKKYDIKKFNYYSKKFDAYILLTKQMNTYVNKSLNKKYMVMEGIADSTYLNNEKRNIEIKDNIKRKKTIITYAGTLHEKFGIKHLINAFRKIDDDDFVLNICGVGDSVNYVKNAALTDKRIVYHGQVDNKVVKEMQKTSDILINPRLNDNKFTQFSFPSKNLEYLETGVPVIAYKLDGIPEEYEEVLFYPNDNTIDSLKNKLIEVGRMTSKEKNEYKEKVKQFLKNKDIEAVALKIGKFLAEVKKC